MTRSGEAITPNQKGNMSNRFLDAYIECALWSTNDESRPDGGDPLDRHYTPASLSPDTLARMTADCQQFWADNINDLATVARLCDDAKAGHNFWLNRNGHGTGFWDEYFGPNRALRNAFNRLSSASKAWGTFDLYVGDDGQIHS